MSRLHALLICVLALGASQSPGPATGRKSAPPPARKSALDKATLEAYVRHLFVWGPQVKVEIAEPKLSTRLPGFWEVKVRGSAGAAAQEELFYVSKDGAKILKAMVFDVAQHPFQEELAKLNTQSQPAFGPPDAPVALVLFSDFQCGYCKEEAETLRKNVPAAFPKEVRVYFKDFPLDGIHPWARTASIAGRCIFRQNPAGFWDFHDWIYAHQGEITPENLKAKVMQFARGREHQIDALQLQGCLEARTTEAEVDRNVADGKALQVNSTPTLFVNGRRLVGNLGWSHLRQIIEYEIGYQRAAGNAGPHCCTVEIPSPVKD
jgi:protein-disulfide isomerase